MGAITRKSERESAPTPDKFNAHKTALSPFQSLREPSEVDVTSNVTSVTVPAANPRAGERFAIDEEGKLFSVNERGALRYVETLEANAIEAVKAISTIDIAKEI